MTLLLPTIKFSAIVYCRKYGKYKCKEHKKDLYQNKIICTASNVHSEKEI